VTFQELLAAELESLSRFARVLTGDREQAHDILFDVLEKAQRGWPRIAELEQPAAYLRKMVLNQYVDERRRWSNRMIRPTRSRDAAGNSRPRWTAAGGRPDRVGRAAGDVAASTTSRRRAALLPRPVRFGHR